MTKRFDSLFTHTLTTVLCGALSGGLLLAGCSSDKQTVRSDRAHTNHSNSQSNGAVADHNARVPAAEERERPPAPRAQVPTAERSEVKSESEPSLFDAPSGLVDGLASVFEKQSPDVQSPEPIGSERYAEIEEADYIEVSERALSTFAIDVDTAAYANVRRFIENGQRPPRDAVRI